MPPTLRGARSEGGSRDEGRRRTDDEGRGTRERDEEKRGRTLDDDDEGRGTRDEEKRGRTTEDDDDDDDDEGRGTRDEFRARFVSALYLRDSAHK